MLRFWSPKLRPAFLLLALTLISTTILISTPAQASPIFETPLARILFRTPEGASVLKRAMGGRTRAYSDFLKHIRSREMTELRKELEEAVDEVSELLELRRRMQYPEYPHGGRFTELSREEIQALRILIKQRFRMNPKWRLENEIKTVTSRVDFAAGRRGSSLSGARERFLSYHEQIPGKVVYPTSETPLFKRVTTFFGDTRRCLSTQSAQQQKLSNREFRNTSRLIDVFMSGASYVLNMGEREFRWKNWVDWLDLSYELGITALSIWLKPKLITNQNVSTKMKFMQITAYGQGRAAVDAVFWWGRNEVVPESESRPMRDVVERFNYNSVYNVPASIKTIGWYRAVEGIKCMIDERLKDNPAAHSAAMATTKGVRMIESYASGYLYYNLRRRIIDQ